MKFLNKLNRSTVLILIILSGLVLRLWHLNQSFWLDEAAQAIISSQTIKEILAIMPADFHPPLFNLLAHFWLLLGDQELVLRLLPVIFGLVSIWAIYLAGNLFNRKVALFAALLISINPFAIYYSQEFRPYALSMLLGIFSIYFLYRSLQGHKRMWWYFMLVTTLHLYTSYLAIFLILAQFFTILIIKQLRVDLFKFCLFSALSVILFLPWLPNLSGQLKLGFSWSSQSAAWVNAVSIPASKVIPLTLAKFVIGQINFSPLVLYVLVLSIIGLIWSWIIYQGFNKKDTLWLYLLITIVIGLFLATIFSIGFQVVSPKQLIFLLPICILLLANGLTRLSTQNSYFVTFLLIIISIICYLIYQLNPSFQREDWRDAVRLVDNKVTTDDLILFKFNGLPAPFIWYSDKPAQGLGLLNTLQFEQSVVEQKLTENLPNKNQIFLFDYLEGITDPEQNINQDIEQFGFKKIDTYDFNGVGLIDEYQRIN
ncbi:glycosyltransferase family 39 protein [Patescibacteria group bacterium]|nr:glycosyltransferase family 39 protein [Patescibacteria group bacterium]